MLTRHAEHEQVGDTIQIAYFSASPTTVEGVRDLGWWWAAAAP
jgi:hypothetical protein